MALHDIDKSGSNRVSPVLNAHDTTLARMAHGTTSINPVTPATDVGGSIRTADGRALVTVEEVKQVSLGVHGDSTAGLRISQAGIDVDEATPAQLVFDSSQQVYRVVNTTATVQTAGTSDSPDIQLAIDNVADSGGGVVVLKNGTYPMSSDIIMPDNVTLTGETSGGAVIDFQNQAYQILVAGSNAYTTGSIFTSTGSTTITGIGTQWNGNMTGQSILLAGSWYLIDSVESATSLTIDSPFTQSVISTEVTGGVIFPATFPAIFGTIVGASYVIASPLSNTGVTNLTVQNSTHSDGAVFFQYTQGSIFDTVNVFSSTIGVNFFGTTLVTAQGFFTSSCGVGIQIMESGVFTLYNFECFDSTAEGLLADNFINASISNFTISSSVGNNVLATNCAQWSIFDAAITSGGSHGIELQDCSDIQIFSMNIQSQALSAIKLTSGCIRTSISTVSFINNGNYGVNILSSDDSKNTVLGCFFDGNGAGDIFDAGLHTIDSANQKQT